MATLFMIGHSVHPWETFQNLLRLHDIATLIDVRSKPGSRQPQFNQKFLKANLDPIQYQHEPHLGGRNPIPAAIQKKELQRILESFTATQRLCLMCSEGDYHDCHRHYTLTNLAIELGWEVMQIARDGLLVPDTGPTLKTLQKMAEFLPGDIAILPKL